MTWAVEIQMKWSRDHRNFKSPKKDFRGLTGFEPVASAFALRCSTNWAMKTHKLTGQKLVKSVLGSVHAYPFSFENSTFSLRIGLPSARIRWKRRPKTQLFENALQSRNCCSLLAEAPFPKKGPLLAGKNCWKLRSVFVFSTELFENDDVTILDPAYPARKPREKQA